MKSPNVIGEPFPLYWPEGVARCASRTRSRYKVSSLAAPRDAILRRLERLGARQIVFSSNVPLRRDGLPMAGVADNLKDPGVAVYFRRKNRDHVIACDRWLGVSENARAIQNTLDALAMIERSATAELLDSTFQGFARLPASTSIVTAKPKRHWRDVFGFDRVQRLDFVDVQTRYRELVSLRHPDVGGSHEALVELNVAMADARQELA